MMWIMAGSAKAIVLPDPVAETATRSRPESAMGQDWHWMGEGLANPARLISAMIWERDRG